MRRLNKNNNGGGMAAQSQSAPSKRRQVSARALSVGDNDERNTEKYGRAMKLTMEKTE